MGQHHVSRFYLKQWTHKGQLYYLNRTTGKIRKCGVKGVANEPLFYQLQQLTPQEVEFIRKVFIEPCSEPLRAIQQRFLDYYILPRRLKAHVEVKARVEGFSLEPTLEKVLDDTIANLSEGYYSHIESCLKPFIVSMLKGDISFYSEPAQAVAFFQGISVQSMRTNRVKQAMISRMIGKYAGCDPLRLWSATNLMMATSVGYSLYGNRENFRLLILNNSTDVPFITGDQPIINLHATFSVKPPQKLEFFYPLSPKKAMLLLEKSNPMTSDSISPIAANRYNMLIAENSYEQLFSDSKDYLESVNRVKYVLPSGL